MILAGIIGCLRGVPGLKSGQYMMDDVSVFHGANDFLFELYTSAALKPTVIVPKKNIISIDLLLPENLDRMCSEMINDTISGEMLYGSAHLFMDGVWYSGKVKKAAVKRILCIAYRGKIEESIETIYLTAGKHFCEKMCKELKEAWKAPPEYYRNNTGGDTGGSSISGSYMFDGTEAM
ncbi:MAG: hypothetical protein ACLSAP_10800 [Oscillospiraceae bacterium]